MKIQICLMPGGAHTAQGTCCANIDCSVCFVQYVFHTRFAKRKNWDGLRRCILDSTLTSLFQVKAFSLSHIPAQTKFS